MRTAFLRQPAFFILADGMGGYKGGQTASISAVRAAKQYLENLPPEDFSEEELRGAAMQANLDILMQKEKNKEFQNMGTTLLLAACAGDTLYWAHVGDSRIYAARGGTLTQVTTDHSVVMDLLRKGKITKEEMIGHPRKMRSPGPSAYTGGLRWTPGILSWKKER